MVGKVVANCLLPSYKHTIIRKTADVGKNMLPLANRVAALLKRWLLGTHQGKPASSHLDYYLDEFVFRFNRRTSKSRGLLFYRLIQQAVNITPVKGRDLLERNLNTAPTQESQEGESSV